MKHEWKVLPKQRCCFVRFFRNNEATKLPGNKTNDALEKRVSFQFHVKEYEATQLYTVYWILFNNHWPRANFIWGQPCSRKGQSMANWQCVISIISGIIIFSFSWHQWGIFDVFYFCAGLDLPLHTPNRRITQRKLCFPNHHVQNPCWDL